MDRLRRSLTLRVVDLKAARQLRRHLQGGALRDDLGESCHKVSQHVATVICHVDCHDLLHTVEFVALLLSSRAF